MAFEQLTCYIKQCPVAKCDLKARVAFELRHTLWAPTSACNRTTTANQTKYTVTPKQTV